MAEAPDSSGSTSDPAAPGPTANAAAASEPASAEPSAEEVLPRPTAAALYGFFLVFFIGLFVGPVATLIIWRLRRDEPFVDLHGRQAMDLIITALLGGLLFFAGRLLEPVQITVAAILQWLALGLVALQVLQGLWAFVDAARGGSRRMPLTITWLRRRGVWARPMA